MYTGQHSCTVGELFEWIDLRSGNGAAALAADVWSLLAIGVWFSFHDNLPKLSCPKYVVVLPWFLVVESVTAVTFLGSGLIPSSPMM